MGRIKHYLHPLISILRRDQEIREEEEKVRLTIPISGKVSRSD